MPSLSASYSSGTLTVQLLNPLSSGNPTSVQVSFLGTTVTAPFDSSWQATVPITLRPEVANYNITGSASIPASEQTTPPIGATGFWLGNPGGPAPGGINDPLQVIPPAASGDPYTIAPKLRSTLRAYSQQLLDPSKHLGSLTSQFQSLYVAVSTVFHAVFSLIVPALEKASLLTLDANESNALTDITSNVLPYLEFTLETLYPSGGSRMEQYQELVNLVQEFQQAAQYYAQAVSEIPNLE